MDLIDERILKMLEEEGRIPFVKIAKRLRVSEGTVRQRVAKLVKAKVIRRFTLDRADRVEAIVAVKAKSKYPLAKIISSISLLGVGKVFEVAGRFDIMCLVASSSIARINEIIDKIRGITGVEDSETFTVLKEA